MTASLLHRALRDTTTVPLSHFRRHYDDRSNWLLGVYVGPGVVIPPRKEDCSCACSTMDRYGRPVHIGLCGPDCERRPR